MSHTVANVLTRPYNIVGADKQTLTDVTVTTNSETVTNAELGLPNAIYDATAHIVTGVSTDTGVYAKAAVATGGQSITLTQAAADGTAATTASGTVIRVRASGY